MAVLPGRTRTEHSTLARAPAEPLLVRTTRWVLRRRHAVIAVWLAALLAGGTRTWSLLLPSLTRRSGRCRTRPRLASSVYFDRKAGRWP